MKKGILSILAFFVILGISQKANAQYTIPSFNITIVTLPTTFEEIPQKNSVCPATYKNLTNKVSVRNSKGRKEIQVGIRPQGGGSNAWSKIEIYSIDGTILQGPYYVTDTQVFRLSLDDQVQWGVRVLDATDYAIFDVWF